MWFFGLKENHSFFGLIVKQVLKIEIALLVLMSHQFNSGSYVCGHSRKGYRSVSGNK
ncbi:MAG: hypothetical protein K6253_01245 [Candidatus Liberibacter asiaticus]|nr:hypothetical protein [Candidatus Liberibacter asiaticus]